MIFHKTHGFTDETVMDAYTFLTTQNVIFRFTYDVDVEGTLESISFYTSAGTGDVRVGFYENEADRPRNAPLVEDLGIVSVTGVGWHTIESTLKPALTDGKKYHIGLRAGGFMRLDVKASLGGADHSFSKLAVGQYIDPTTAWQDPCPVEDSLSSDYAYAGYAVIKTEYGNVRVGHSTLGGDVTHTAKIGSYTRTHHAVIGSDDR